MIKDLFDSIAANPHELDDPEVAHLVVHENEVVSSKVLPGLVVDVKQLPDGIDADIRLADGVVLKNAGAFLLRAAAPGRDPADHHEGHDRKKREDRGARPLHFP